MTFKNWIVSTGLSESSAKKYESAVKGSISGWAMEAGIVNEPLTQFQTPEQLQRVEPSIRQLDIFQERDTVGNKMYSGALNKFSEYLEETSENEDIEEDLDDILDDESITETEKKSLVKSRIGQGEFRSRLISHWDGCSVTRYRNFKLLMASHIKPWKESDNEERLDVHNGLLLLPNLDKAFDKGYITFRKSGIIKISEYFNEATLFGVREDMKIDRLGEDHQEYLNFHRRNVFLD